jgi:type I restriction enzyme S subunit
MKLKTVKLKEIVSMKYGIMPKPSIISENGYPIYSGYGITGYAKQFLYRESQLIVVARGVGGTGDVKISPESAWITNLSLILELDKEKVDRTYLYYKLKKEPLRKNLNTGAAQAQITIGVLENYKVKIHELAMQKKIALNIASYDDLIDINHRWIKLLEESARLLFREWFVYFRFPGHKNVKMVGGVPAGWKKTYLGKIASQIKKSYSINDEDLPLVDLARIQSRTLTINEVGSSSDLETARIIFEKDDVLFSSIRPYLHKVFLSPFKGITNTSVFVIRAKKHNFRAYITLLLFSDYAIQFANQHSTGTKMPVVKWSSVSIVTAFIPPEKIIDEFQKIAGPMLGQIQLLYFQNQKLTQARDLLLPRLMNGTIDVSELNTKIPEEA